MKRIIKADPPPPPKNKNKKNEKKRAAIEIRTLKTSLRFSNPPRYHLS